MAGLLLALFTGAAQPTLASSDDAAAPLSTPPIDNASDLVWSLGGRATYQVSPNFFIWGGYNIIDYDYTTGSGVDEFALNGRFEGPILGGGFTF